MTTGVDEVSPTPCNSPAPSVDEDGAVLEMSLEPQHAFNFYQKSADQERITEFINQKPQR